MLKFCFILSFFVCLMNMQAQNKNEHIGLLMNEAKWFELKQEIEKTSTDSVTPVLYKMATAMTHYYFNRPDSACMVIADLLNNHQQELGNNTINMVILLGVNLARCEKYDEASAIIQELCNQLSAQGVDKAQITPYNALAKQYSALASIGSICKPLHKVGEYRLPMLIENDNKQHFIEMDGSINGKETRMVFDTGAGGNMISPELAKKYGLRSLDIDTNVGGIGGMKQGYYAIADTLCIGNMSWSNVPFYVIDNKTGHNEADIVMKKLQLPPVIGLPIMLNMQEVQLDFARQEIIIPVKPTKKPINESNLLRTDSECLLLKTTDKNRNPLYFHFDTGSYYTRMGPAWYKRHKNEVNSIGTPDSLREAGIGGVKITQSYIIPQINFRIGNGIAELDAVCVDTGIDLHTGEIIKPEFSEGKEDGSLGLNTLEKFSKVILNLRDMYLEAIPYTK